MKEITERLKKYSQRIYSNSNLLAYSLFAIVVYLGVWIRTRNIGSLRDVTTGGWTLGPDLDPFLFLRYAKYIVENGSLFAVDPMRYVPLGFDTGVEFPLLHNSIALFHKIASIFGSTSVEQSAVIYPVFMFALTLIAFFFMTREIFADITGIKSSNYIALIASLFLSIIPAFIPRTIAGIPEKESAAFFFLFTAFYFILLGWKNKGLKGYLFSSIAGIFAAGMALTWGGFIYLSLIASLTILVMFFFKQMNLNKSVNYTLFVFVMYLLQVSIFERVTIGNILNNFDSIFVITSLAVIWMHIGLHKYGQKFIAKPLRKYPYLASVIYAGLVLLIAGLLVFGPKFILVHATAVYNQITQPATSRLIQTVAENRQPFLTEWAYNYGPVISDLPLLLIIAFLASIILLYASLRETQLQNRDKWKIIGSWVVFLFAVTYTRYSESSLFNGTNFISKTIYFLGIFAPLVCFIYIFFKEKKSGKDNPYSSFTLGAVLTLIFFAIGLISARAYIRLVLVLVPVVSILVGYIFIRSCLKTYNSIKIKEYVNFKTAFYLLIILLVIFSAYTHFSNSKALAQNYIPSSYTQQWQFAMSWVRENTPTNSVFGHWWDYGYWIQSIGERATVLDGGNLIGYWNHLMGRNALTETDFTKTLEFLYAHNVTHFLIDSTDIGKYSAFSTIGSDPNYDRRSWIPTFLRDNSQTTERKNNTVFVYSGGTSIDQDIRYNLNGSEIFLPEGKSYIIATIVTVDDKDKILEVYGVYYFQNKTYQIPLRYYWDNEVGFVDAGKGLNAGVFIYPRVILNNQGGGDVEARGASLYLSPRTVMSNVARFYLYGQENNYFELLHSEQDQLVKMLQDQNAISTEFVFFNEFRGPIKIWGVSYPENMRINEEYLKTEFPSNIEYA